MAALPPPLPPQLPRNSNGSSNTVAATVLIWLAWLGVTLMADFLGFMMFAFADSPSSANAAKLLIVPVFIWFGVTLVAGAILLIFRGWWQIVLAFLLAISPPFLVFVGYNLLSGQSRSAVPTNVVPSTPPVIIRQRYFVPAPTTVPTQPDFQKAIRAATQQAAATQPASK